MPTNTLYHTWFQRIQELRPNQRITQVRNFVWLMTGILQSRSVCLSRIAGKIPGPAKLLSTTRRLSRLLDNPAIRVREWYEPIARQWLEAQFRHLGEIRLIVDGTKIGFGHQLLIVSLAYRKRAIPIAWTWVKHARGHSSAIKQMALLAYIRSLIPAGAAVFLVGDCEFGSVAVLRHLDRWRWFYVLRQKSDTGVWFDESSGWQTFGSTIHKPGQSIWLGRGYLTIKEIYPTHLLVHWKVGEKEPWCLATNLPDRQIALRCYARRMWIEIVCTQMTKASVFATGAGWDNIADFNFFIVNDHSIDQQFYQLPTLFKIQIIQGWLNLLAKLLDVVCQCEGFNLLLGLVLQLSQLLLETVLGSRQFLTLSLKFVSHDDFRQVHFQETILLTFQTCQGLSDGIAFCLQGLRQPFSSLGALQFVGNQVRVDYNSAEILPDQFIKFLGWRITGCTTLTLSGSMNITSSPACVIVVPPLGTPGRRQMALPATDQTSEKVIVAFIIATCHILVFLQTRLSRIKYILINDAWNRDFNPLLHRGRLDAFTSSYRQHGRFAPSCRDWSGTPAVGHTNIRRRMQNAPNRGWIPTFASSWSGNLLFVQLFDNPVHRDRCFWVSIPGKDLPYNVGFDRVNPHPARISGPFRVQDISVRRSGPRQQAPGSEFGLPSTPHSICNQVALVFSHRPSDLKQELVMGIILLHRAFQKVGITTQFFHLLDQQNLMNIFTRQSIRCGYQDQLESCHAGGISQTIQSRTIELGPRVTIVAINMLRCQLPIGILCYSLLQSLNLLFNALTLHLTVGRYSGINGDLHGHSPEWVIPGVVGPRSASSSSAEETDRCSPSGVAHRNILRLRDELAILFSYFLLNVVYHLGEAYPKFLFPQSQRAAPPRQLHLTPSCQTEFVICDQTIEEMYGDFKKHGFDLERTMLRHFLRLSRLTLAVAILYIWLLSVGTRTIRSGLRSLVDRTDRRDLSIFQIGLRFIERCLTNAIPFRISLCSFR